MFFAKDLKNCLSIFFNTFSEFDICKSLQFLGVLCICIEILLKCIGQRSVSTYLDNPSSCEICSHLLYSALSSSST